jgi:hypothetical protein
VLAARRFLSSKGNSMTDSRQEEWLIVRLPHHLIDYLRRWAAEDEVPVSVVMAAAVAKLCQDLKAERATRFQQAPTKRESP